MKNAVPTWSKEEIQFATRFKNIEADYKSDHQADTALNNLEILSEHMRQYEQAHGDSPLMNTLEIVSCSMRTKIFDEREEPNSILFYFEKIRENLNKSHTLLPEQRMRLLKEYSDYLAVSENYRQALVIGYEALKNTGESLKHSIQLAQLYYHLSALHFRMNHILFAIDKCEKAWKIYYRINGASSGQEASELHELSFVVAQNLAELYIYKNRYDEALDILNIALDLPFQIKEQVVHHWKLYLLQGDCYLKKGEHPDAEKSYREVRIQIERIKRVYPELINENKETYDLCATLFKKLAQVYSQEGKFAEAYATEQCGIDFTHRCFRREKKYFEESFFSSNNHIKNSELHAIVQLHGLRVIR